MILMLVLLGLVLVTEFEVENMKLDAYVQGELHKMKMNRIVAVHEQNCSTMVHCGSLMVGEKLWK